MDDYKFIEDCNFCTYCSPKEAEQTDKKEPHICKKYHEEVRHLMLGKHHPSKLFPCKNCTIWGSR